MSRLIAWRRAAGAAIADTGFRATARVTSANPLSWPSTHGVERIRNIRYRDSKDAAHLLDIYLPDSNVHPPRPAVVYFHGGGFRILSKDSHYVMGIAFARRGYVTIVPDYRKAPQHQFPAAHDDAFRAYEWALEHSGAMGARPGEVIVAGESAGGNLAASVVAATCWDREEPFAAGLRDVPAPVAAVPLCPFLEISDAERFRRRRHIPTWLNDRVMEVSMAYLDDIGPAGPAFELANPLQTFESERAPTRPIPPFCLSVGTKDPLLDDTRRMAAALARRGVACDVAYYSGERHAFQAFVWRKNARAAWSQIYDFLQEHVP